PALSVSIDRGSNCSIGFLLEDGQLIRPELLTHGLVLCRDLRGCCCGKRYRCSGLGLLTNTLRPRVQNRGPFFTDAFHSPHVRSQDVVGTINAIRFQSSYQTEEDAMESGGFDCMLV